MKTIEQEKHCDVEVEEADESIYLGGFVVLDKQGAAELIKVLQEWVDEKH